MTEVRKKANSPLARYKQQKARTIGRVDANGKPIQFLLTFEDWWDIWQKSGKWAERGNKRQQYVMSRKKDLGPYDIDNVEIIRGIDNVRLGRNPENVSILKQMVVQCPKCGQIGKDAGMRIWHFDNCGKQRPVITCPHCGKTGGRVGMKRWHFDNCKHR